MGKIIIGKDIFMKFITYSVKEIEGKPYACVYTPHILISIRCPGEQVTPSPNTHCKDTLELYFDDVSGGCVKTATYFTQDDARKILDTVDKCVQNRIELIVTHCHAGISRSVAVNSALSKILNYTDDDIFHSGIPNMWVYTTILDTFFLSDYTKDRWKNIHLYRTTSMDNILPDNLSRLNRLMERRNDTR